jgi:protein-tyrosine phosphatase
MPLKVLMVCLGNICRSPMAHGLLQHKVTLHQLDWEIDSAGTTGYHKGELPDKRAIACMKRHGIDITFQQSRPITAADLRYYDLIYVMDHSNLNDVSEMARTETELEKIFLVMSLANEKHPEDVPDPYFGAGDYGFETVYKMLDQATDKLIEKYSTR